MLLSELSLTYITMTIIFALYNIYALNYASKILTNFKKRYLVIFSISLFNVLLYLYGFFQQIPNYLIYIIGFIVVSVEFYVFSKTKFIQVIFGCTTFIVTIAMIQLVTVSTMSLMLKIPTYSIFAIKQLHCYSSIITFIMSMCALTLLTRLIKTSDIIIISNDKQQSLMVSFLGCFMITYLCFMSMLLIKKETYVNLEISIISTALLSALIFYLLLTHALKISMSRHFKAKMYALESEYKHQLIIEEKLKTIAYKDSLTNCFTRDYIINVLKKMLEDKVVHYNIVYVDLDGLKAVNDNLGHNKGDEYLITVSKCLLRSLRETDILARMGGDEFMLILSNCSEDDARGIIERVGSNLKTLGEHKQNAFHMSMSYGILHVDDKLLDKSCSELIQIADQKMYEKKQKYHQHSLKKEV